MPENTDRRPHWKKRFMQGHISRPEKEEKEEIYHEQWPDYVKQLRTRYVYFISLFKATFNFNNFF